MGDIEYESATLAAPPGQGGLATQGLSTKARSAGGGGVVRIWRAAETLDTMSVLMANGAVIDIPWSGNVKSARRAGTGAPSEAATVAPSDDFIEQLRQKRDAALAAKGLPPAADARDRVKAYGPVGRVEDLARVPSLGEAADPHGKGPTRAEGERMSRSERGRKGAEAMHAKRRAAKGEAA